MTEVTREIAQKVLDTVNAGLTKGIGEVQFLDRCVLKPQFASHLAYLTAMSQIALHHHFGL